MDWNTRLTAVTVIVVFAAGYVLGWHGRVDERVRDRRRRRLVERLEQERGL